MKNITLLFGLISTLAFGQLEQNLLLHYTFDGNVSDSSDNGNDGTPDGITFGEDRFGNLDGAVYFDGINDFIDLPNIEDLKPNFPLSFSFFIKYESTSVEDRAVFDTSFQDDLSSGVYFNSQSSTGKHAVNHGDGSPFYNATSRRTYVSNNAIVINEWYHIAVVLRTSTDMEIYVNCQNSGGEHSGEGGVLQYATAAGSIGRHDRDLGANPLHFKGALDDFRYWDRAITISEIIELCDENLGIIDNKNETFSIIPNPAKNIVFLESRLDTFNTYQIFDSVGRLRKSGRFTKTIHVDELTNGMYFIRLIGETNVATQKLLIQK